MTANDDDDTGSPGAVQWRTLHSHVVDAVLAQHDDVVDILLRRFGGLTFAGLMRGLNHGGARIRSNIENDQLVYLVEVMADDDWVVLTRPTATALGIPDTPELREQELAFHTERMVRDLERNLGAPDPDSPPPDRE